MEQENKAYKVREAFKLFCKKLSGYYQPQECKSLTYLLFEEYLQMKKTDILLNPDKIIPESQIIRISSAIEELRKFKPIQYITGKANFLGLDFVVSPHVLIPRPETEELVLWIIDDHKEISKREEDITILDIGSGSGSVAISLDKQIEKAKVTGIDINVASLEIARKNNELHGTQALFTLFNILDEDKWNQLPEYDIIVSNPPYVRESEKPLMSRNVLDYEPPEALFVSDDDPLIFYRTILRFSQSHLHPNGRVYFEINEAFGSEVTALFEEYGFKDVLLREDIFGRNRFVRGINRLKE